MTHQAKTIFWSFRRCPYAMRARLAVKSSGIEVHLREILLRDKPDEFLQASQKGTVPVLEVGDGQVIDESLDVMFWALSQSDPEGWLDIYHTDKAAVEQHLSSLDTDFKFHLDRYKYATRYDDVDEKIHRQEAVIFLESWNEKLTNQTALSGSTNGILDYATLPFVRQFRIADMEWFDAQDWPALHNWLQTFLNSERFASVMTKYAPWKDTGEEHLF